MSLKKVEQVKVDKGFKILDFIIYAIIAVTVAVMFLVVFLNRNTDALTGVRVFVRGEVVFEYEFDGTPVYSETVTADDVKEDEKGLTVTVNSAGGGVNVIYIDKTAKTAKMLEANCSIRKDCVNAYPWKIDDNSKTITCNPHGLRIEPFLRDYSSPDIVM